MTQVMVPPMAPGGKWIQPAHEAPPVYVRHEAHIRRLMMDGGTMVSDPRRAEDWVKAQPSAQTSREDALQAEIDQLKAMVQTLLAQVSQPVLVEPEPVRIEERKRSKSV